MGHGGRRRRDKTRSNAGGREIRTTCVGRGGRAIKRNDTLDAMVRIVMLLGICWRESSAGLERKTIRLGRFGKEVVLRIHRDFRMTDADNT